MFTPAVGPSVDAPRLEKRGAIFKFKTNSPSSQRSAIIRNRKPKRKTSRRNRTSPSSSSTARHQFSTLQNSDSHTIKETISPLSHMPNNPNSAPHRQLKVYLRHARERTNNHNNDGWFSRRHGPRSGRRQWARLHRQR